MRLEIEALKDELAATKEQLEGVRAEVRGAARASSEEELSTGRVSSGAGGSSGGGIGAGPSSGGGGGKSALGDEQLRTRLAIREAELLVTSYQRDALQRSLLQVLIDML